MSEIEFEDMGGYYANKDFRERTATGTVTLHVVQTNADRIRSMNDEELAEFLTSENFVDVPWCLRWLKSPVEVSE